MCQLASASVPSFLIKLREILNSIEYMHIIRWDKFGQSICIVCINALEELVLPHHFRHSRYSSFVRQLNMYGFNKKKSEKNITATFYNKHFSKQNMEFPAMGKKVKKQKKRNSKNESIREGYKSNEEIQNQNDFSTELDQNSLKISAYNKQLLNANKFQIQVEQTGPQMCELIEELSGRIEPLLNQTTYFNFRELQILISEPKYQKVNYAVLKSINFEEMGILVEIPICPFTSDRMELIL